MRLFIMVLCGLLAAASGAAADGIQPATPVNRPPPAFPAAAGEVEGYVKLGFKIGADGHVKDAIVLESAPEKLFDQSALDAVSRWTYQPRTDNGRAVEQPDNKVLLRFKPGPPPPQRKLLYAPKPAYPPNAFQAKVEGTVKVAFDIGADGRPANVHATEASLPGVFDDAAIKNVGEWVFEAAPPGGASVATPMETTIAFKLDQARVGTKPVKIIPPSYPLAAEELGLSGRCKVDFVVEPDGSVGDPKIEMCFPAGIFETATLGVIKKWLFEPGRNSAGAVETPATYTINYLIQGTTLKQLQYLKAGQWIKLRYTLTESGRAKEVEVIDRSDPDLSARKAIEQVQNTQFSPIIENGKPVEKPGQEIRIVGH
jgi:TonB family protein